MALSSLFLALIMVFSSIGGAFAQTPEMLAMSMTNYSSAEKISVSFDSCDDLLALLKEVDLLDDFEKFVDVEALVSSLVSYNEEITLQLDASDDYSQFTYALTADSAKDIIFNKNLNVSVNSKMGAWVKADLSDSENPSIEFICNSPILNKYATISLADVLKHADDEDKAMVSAVLKSIFNKEFMDSLSAYYGELITKYGEPKLSGNKYTLHFSNESLLSMIEDVIAHLPQLLAPVLEAAGFSEDELTEAYEELDSFPSLKGLQLLGDGGITIVYTLSGKNISACEISTDFSFNIANIFEVLSGEEWEYSSRGQIDFTLEASQNFSNIGKTKVSLPSLNEENSFSCISYFEDMFSYDEYEAYEYIPDYPYRWVSGYTDTLPIIDGNIYLPLRDALTEAFYDNVTISYDNGKISLTSDYFPGFKNIALFVGGDKAYTEFAEYHIGQVILENGTTYVSRKLFEDVLGWTLQEVNHAMISGGYRYSFMTEKSE